MDLIGLLVERLRGCNLAGQNPKVFRAIDESAAYSLKPDCRDDQSYICVVPFDRAMQSSGVTNTKYDITERFRIIGFSPRSPQQRDVNDGGDAMSRSANDLLEAVAGRLAGFVPASGNQCTLPAEILRQSLINTDNFGRAAGLTILRIQYQAQLQSVCNTGEGELPEIKGIDANFPDLRQTETPDFSLPASKS